MRFTMQIMMWHFIKNELTPTPTAIPTSNWQLLIYPYHSDGAYTNQPVYETNLERVLSSYPEQHPNRLTISLSADVTRRELQTKFGDCRAFTFQVKDEHKKIQQQGYFYITPYHILFHEGGIKGDFKDGVTVGYPYSLQESEAEFFRQGKFVIINEPQSGFYRLSYIFNLGYAAGISGTSLEAAGEPSIRLFPYQENGKYSAQNSYPLVGEVNMNWGGFTVDLPIDYLRERVNGNNMYYLQIVDGKGKIIKDEYFIFVPYTP